MILAYLFPTYILTNDQVNIPPSSKSYNKNKTCTKELTMISQLFLYATNILSLNNKLLRNKIVY